MDSQNLFSFRKMMGKMGVYPFDVFQLKVAEVTCCFETMG